MLAFYRGHYGGNVGIELRCKDELRGSHYISLGKRQWGLHYDVWSGLDIQGEM